MTTSVAGTLQDSQKVLPGGRRRRSSASRPAGASPLALHDFLAARVGSAHGAAPILDAARRRAQAAFRAAGGDEAADRLAASVFAGDALIGLAVEQLLDPTLAREVALQLVATTDGSLDATLLELFLRAASDPVLADLPPLFAIETQLRLLVSFGVATDVSLWLRPRPGRIECAVSLGDDDGPSRRTRTVAKLTLARGPAATLARRAQIHSVLVKRWGRPEAALVARIASQTRSTAQVYLHETANALTPLLERAALLERSAEREQTITTGSERRLTRLGFDLHDGPIQDVIALAGEVRALRDEVYPFVVEAQRATTERRFDELVERLAELDGDLRELAHSLESRSAVSRPLEEVLHREVDAFAARTGIEARLRIDGACSFLTTSQRIALFRAVQEALSNAREHSGATTVDVRLRARRSWTELRVWDNGRGFAVEPALASAAKRGRLGIVGISERVRMLGGTFELESAPGGPTRLSISLPRWEPLDPAAG